MQDPKDLLSKKFGKRARSAAMRNVPLDSNEAVADRLKLLRAVVSGENQTAFATKLGVEVRRWNNFERKAPLSKEVAILIVKKFPDVTLDWLFFGNESGLPVRFQRELAEAAGKLKTATTGRSRSKAG